MDATPLRRALLAVALALAAGAAAAPPFCAGVFNGPDTNDHFSSQESMPG